MLLASLVHSAGRDGGSTTIGSGVGYVAGAVANLVTGAGAGPGAMAVSSGGIGVGGGVVGEVGGDGLATGEEKFDVVLAGWRLFDPEGKGHIDEVDMR